MRVLLDECVSEGLRNHLAGHECQTTRYAGFVGLENGQLLTSAEAAKFDVLLTVDRGFGSPRHRGRKNDRRKAGHGLARPGIQEELERRDRMHSGPRVLSNLRAGRLALKPRHKLFGHKLLHGRRRRVLRGPRLSPRQLLLSPRRSQCPAE